MSVMNLVMDNSVLVMVIVVGVTLALLVLSHRSPWVEKEDRGVESKGDETGYGEDSVNERFVGGETPYVSTQQGEGQVNYPLTHNYRFFPLLENHNQQPPLEVERVPFDPNMDKTPPAYQNFPGNPPFDNHLNPTYKARDNETNVFKQLDSNLVLPEGMQTPNLEELRGEFQPDVVYRPHVRGW